MSSIPTSLHEETPTQTMPSAADYHKTLGVHWDSDSDNFHVSTSQLPSVEALTKRALVSDIAKTFDVLGWFTPSTIVMKILMQTLWEAKVTLDEEVPAHIYQQWATS